ncbi:MAG: hypothetical protein R2731_00090 [Nocardioides sp.]
MTRSYASCADDGLPARGDLCWKKNAGALVNELTLTLNGRSGELIPNGADEFRLRDDPGWRIEWIHGSNVTASNADNDNEAFKLTTQDGTVYWFGYGNGTQSVWTVPVYGNDSGEPCYNATTKNAWCQQGWRWNLDRVVDTSGNKIVYRYEDEQNYYSRWATTTSGFRTGYDRSGWLSEIRYGFGTSDGFAHDTVDVSTVPRCIPALTNPSATCTGTSDPKAAPGKWPDVPADLICESTGACDNFSPSFFSSRRYYQLTSWVHQGQAGSTVNDYKVDRYTLGHTMPDPDDSNSNNSDEPDLWLNRIDREGFVTNSSTDSMPAVTFDGTTKKNLVTQVGSRWLRKFG